MQDFFHRRHHPVGFGKRSSCGGQVIQDEAALIHLRHEVRPQGAIAEIRSDNENHAKQAQRPRMFQGETQYPSVAPNQPTHNAGGLPLCMPALRRPPVPQQYVAERRSPGQRQYQRSRQGHAHGDGESAEERARHSADGDQRQENDDRRNGRPDQRIANLAHRAADRLPAALSGVAMEHDVFHHHDGVVDHQAHRRRQTAQGHQVKALPQGAQRDKGDGHGGRNHQARHQRRPPVPQEQHQNNGRQKEPDQDRIAHAPDGILHQFGLIVEGRNGDPARQRLANQVDLGVHPVRHRHRVAVRLPVYVQQHRGFAVRGNGRIDWLHRRPHAGDVADAHGNPGGRGLHDDGRNFFGRAGLSAHQPQNQLVIALDQAWRIDHVAALHRIQNGRNVDAGLNQLRGIRADLELRYAPALDDDGGDARHAVEPGLHFIGGQFPQGGGRNVGRRQAVADDGERGEGQTVGSDFGVGRQGGLHPRQRRVDQLQRPEHVHVPREEQVHLGRTAAGDRPHLLDALHGAHGFLDGLRDGDQHLIDGRDPVIDADHDAGEVGLREDRDRYGERQVHAGRDQSGNDE